MLNMLSIILISIVFLLYCFIPIEYKTDAFLTLLFTVIVFFFSFFLKKRNSTILDSNLGFILFSLFFLASLAYLIKIPNEYLISIFLLGILTIVKYGITHIEYEKIFKEKCNKEYRKLESFLWRFKNRDNFGKYLKKSEPKIIPSNIEEYKFTSNHCFFKNNFRFIVDKDRWKNIITIFSRYHKKESHSLAKKNNMLEKVKYEANDDKATISNILRIRHDIDLFHTFHDTIISLNKKNEYQEEAKLLANIIFKLKMIHYNMNILIVNEAIIKVISFLQSFIVGMIFIKLIIYMVNMVSLFPPFVTSLIGKGVILFGDVLFFASGMAVLFMVIPFTYLFYTHLKLSHLKIWVYSSHMQNNVFTKNLFYYLSSFFISMVLTIVGIGLLAYSGVEYNQVFHFVASLFLPIMDIDSIPALIAHLFKDDLIFGIFTIKIIFLLFIFALGILLIQNVMEKYIQLYDNNGNSIYSIPPEFAKFFSYLMLILFSIILLYGSLFINYPNLSNSYNECRPYLQEKENIDKNSSTVKYCKKYQSDKDATPKYIQKECKEFLDSNVSDRDDTSLSATHCNVLMNKFVYKDNKFKNGLEFKSASRSLSDYLPLSIFLALFGTLIMVSTKNLLENYFTGLSLKIDPPFDEGERVRIDNGEMLAVQTIGFRATTFYGIESNAHLVIPHEVIKKSIVTNYTQPTLDYREKIKIYVPDTNKNISIPREAEKVLLLAAFASTGVKKPQIKLFEEVDKKIQDYISDIHSCLSVTNNIDALKTFEKRNEALIEEIWEVLKGKKEKEKQELFLNSIFKLLDEPIDNNEDRTKIEKRRNTIKKLVIAIYSVLYKKEHKKLNYHIDDFLIKRKFESFKKIKKDDLNDLSKYLVNINYYYFALAKQLWELKGKDNSVQRKKDYDNASLELLDVPRVTSAHKRDIDGAFWEITLLVTVELGEQSDEIIQHINMYIDELWDKFDLPYRCILNNDEVDTNKK